MSWLHFSRSKGQITLYGGDPKTYGPPHLLGIWPAHNRTAKKSKGAWPSGTWKWTHYNTHSEAGMMPACHPTTYGCFGIHVFDVKGRSGMGVHAGRTNGQDDVLGWNTMGCVRVPPNAMTKINSVHGTDPLVSIKVEE